MNDIKVKVIIKANNFELHLTEDYTEYAEDLIDCRNVFSNSNILMTEENILDYFKEGIYLPSDIDSLNGSHFLYGYIECLAQDYKYSNILSDLEIISFEVKLV